MFPKVFEAMGVSYPELVDRLIRQALARAGSRPASPGGRKAASGLLIGLGYGALRDICPSTLSAFEGLLVQSWVRVLVSLFCVWGRLLRRHYGSR